MVRGTLVKICSILSFLTVSIMVVRGMTCGDPNIAPSLEVAGNGGSCDTSTEDCLRPMVQVMQDGGAFVDSDQLLCKFRDILVNSAAQFVMGSFSIVPGEYVNCTHIICPVPGDSIPSLDCKMLAGWHISVSNENTTFGTETAYLPYDHRCVTCDFVEIACCTWQAGYCFIGGECHMDGVNNYNHTCHVCNVTESCTAWTTLPNTCFVNDTCYDEGDKDPNDSCKQCISGNGTTSFSPESQQSCSINDVCVPDGTVNSANSCEQCDITMSSSQWSPRYYDRANGGTMACANFCEIIRDHGTDMLSAVCSYPSFISPQNFNSMCFLEDASAADCPMGGLTLTRYKAMCSHTTVAAASADPVACP